MGAKTPDQLARRRSTVSCDVCGRKFLNVQALKSHHSFLHTDASGPRRVTPKQKQVQTRQLKKRVVPMSMLKRVIPSPATKQANKSVVKDISMELAGNQTSVIKKPVFECPICAESFPVYFTAFRHIQKNHCVDENGQKVTANSPLLVKPTRIESCATCSKEIRSTEPHNCPKHTSKDQYLCLGCEQVFSGLVLFQHHVKGLHAEGAQNYFFPSREEFTVWKKEVEEQTELDFVRLNKEKSKEIYHCSHQGDTVTTTTKLCPSTITVREYTKGVHVCYYREHCGHAFNNIPLEKYKKYSIAVYLQETEELKLEAEDDNDLYLQFKKMITCIVFDAAKVDITTLKELLGKALEMTSILKHYDGEERNTPLISKCLSDAQISRTLESLKPNQKRAPEIIKVNQKRKLSPLPKEITKVETKKVKRDSPTIEKLVENGVSTRTSRKGSPALNKSVSFNKSLPKKNEEPEEKPLPQEKKPLPQEKKPPPQEKKPLPQEKKPLAQEKKPISQEKKPLLQEKKPQPQEKKPLLQEKKPLLQEKKPLLQEKKNKDELAPTTPVQQPLIQSPSSFNDSYKNFVDQNFKCLPESSTPKPRANTRKKEVVKTKIGQFRVKPSGLSPKDNSPKNTSQKDTPAKDSSQKLSMNNSSKVSVPSDSTPKVVKEIKQVSVNRKKWNAVPEIKYEVKEQENDCNILILKI